MELLNIDLVDINYKKIGEISQKRNNFYRKILYDIEKNSAGLFKTFLKNFQTLQDIMKMKSAKQEAASKEELKVYLKNLHNALDYVVEKVSDNKIFSDHHEIIFLHNLIDPEAHLKHPNGYRNTLVMVGNHLAPEPERIFSMMNNLMYNLDKIANPLVKAIYAHHEIVRIHPFVDGNGRTARLVMNWILMYELFPPVFIKTAECRRNYIKDLDESFSRLETDPNSPNDATNRFFNDEIERVNLSVEFLIKTMKEEHPEKF